MVVPFWFAFESLACFFSSIFLFRRVWTLFFHSIFQPIIMLHCVCNKCAIAIHHRVSQCLNIFTLIANRHRKCQRQYKNTSESHHMIHNNTNKNNQKSTAQISGYHRTKIHLKCQFLRFVSVLFFPFLFFTNYKLLVFFLTTQFFLNSPITIMIEFNAEKKIHKTSFA